MAWARFCVITFLGLGLSLLIMRLTASKPPNWTITPNNSLKDSVALGRDLAERYCAMCHVFPEPDLLDKVTWETLVLPEMGMRLGIKVPDKDPYKGLHPSDSTILKRLHIYPESPLISLPEWKQIETYYLSKAPGSLPRIAKSNEAGPSVFKANFIQIGEGKLPKVSLLKFRPGFAELYIGDDRKLYVLDREGRVANAWALNSPPVGTQWLSNGSPLVLTIGSIAPTDRAMGRLGSLFPGSGMDISHLRRPVDFKIADVNGDGTNDVIVCQFGNHLGRLSWFDGLDLSKEHILGNAPGATRVELCDMDGDGRDDIVALMAQAWEQVSIFYNQGQGNFDQKTVLRFPPVFGTSYFELADFNGDDHQDLLVTFGDNWDYSRIDKPYHGLRIFLNDGNDRFQESYFYPMHGCRKAMARDFDGDGDLDIVAAAFYGDGDEGFVYLEQTGPLVFRPHFQPETRFGKWITMDVGDFDQDGRPDVALGSFLYNLGEMGRLALTMEATAFPQVLLLTQAVP